MLPPLYLSAPVAVAESHCWERATGDRHILELALGVSGTTKKHSTHSPEPVLPGAVRAWLSQPRAGHGEGTEDHPNKDHSHHQPSLGIPSLTQALQSHSPARLLLPLVNTWRHHGGQELPHSCHELWREAGVQVLLVTCGAVARLEGKSAKVPLPHPPTSSPSPLPLFPTLHFLPTPHLGTPGPVCPAESAATHTEQCSRE